MGEAETSFLFDIMHEIIDCLVPIELEEEIIATALDGVGADEAAN